MQQKYKIQSNEIEWRTFEKLTVNWVFENLLCCVSLTTFYGGQWTSKNFVVVLFCASRMLKLLYFYLYYLLIQNDKSVVHIVQVVKRVEAKAWKRSSWIMRLISFICLYQIIRCQHKVVLPSQFLLPWKNSCWIYIL